MIGGGGVRPDKSALKQRTRWTGVFFCDLRWAAGAEEF